MTDALKKCPFAAAMEEPLRRVIREASERARAAGFVVVYDSLNTGPVALYNTLRAPGSALH